MEPIDDDLYLAALADLLAAQAGELHPVFACAFVDMLRGKTRSFRDVGRALKAQNLCRIALRLLIALHGAEPASKKSRPVLRSLGEGGNRTIKLLEAENSHDSQGLGQPVERPLVARTAAPTTENFSTNKLMKTGISTYDQQLECEYRRTLTRDPYEHVYRQAGNWRAPCG